MGYVVLARKYRPRNFSQMAGQEHVVRALTNALDHRRLHHAYLFTGTRGVGKTTISRILAKSLNCTGPDGRGDLTSNPCGQCTACVEIDADRYVDYIELDAASNRSIDEIRDLIERAAYKPAIGRFKVFMIDEAHQLTKDAFNALLKTLEEPPDYLKFVLATTDPERMLPTVLSRCLQFNLRPMAPEVVHEHLTQVLRSETIPAEPGALRLLSEAARGSMRDALSLTDQAIAYGAGQLTEQAVAAMLGTTHSGASMALLHALARADGPAVLECARELRLSGASAASVLDEMVRLLQMTAVEQFQPGSIEIRLPYAQDSGELARLFTADELQLAYSILVHGKAELALMSDEHAALTMILLRILAFQCQAPVRAVTRSAPLRSPAPPSLTMPVSVASTASSAALPSSDRAPSLKAQDRAGPAVSPSETERPDTVARDMEPPRHEPVPATSSALADLWDATARRLAEEGRLTGLVRELAWQGGLVDQAEGPPACWRLRVAHESLRSSSLKDKLCEALVQSLGFQVRLELEAGEAVDSPAQRDAALRLRRQQHAESVMREDALVRSLLSQFSTARLVPGSIKPA